MWNLKLLEAIRKQKFSFEEIAWLCDLSETELYCIVKQEVPVGNGIKEKLALAVGTKVEDLF